MAPRSVKTITGAIVLLDRGRNDRPAEVQSLSAAPHARDAQRDHDSRQRSGQQQDRPSRPRMPGNQSQRNQAPAPPISNAPPMMRDNSISPAGSLAFDLPVLVIRFSDSSNPLSSSEQRTRTEPLAVADTTNAAIDGVLASTGDLSSRTSREGPGAVPTATPSNRGIATGAVANSAVAETGGAETGGAGVQVAETQTSTLSPERAINETNVASPGSVIANREGWIDLLPLVGNRPPMEHRSAAEQPWELGGDTLRRLRDVAELPMEPSITVPREASANPTDAAIAFWFQGPGGFIELQSAGTPLIADDASLGMVDIVLDATFGLHRTLDLVAAAEPTSTGEAVRDAILAAIAGEQSATVAPIEEPAANRLSGLAYPAAAILATTLAIAKRHRHANALLATGKTESV